MFISKKHISRRTVLRGMGATIALPLLDAMVPAGVAQAQTAAASKTRLACIEIGARDGWCDGVRRVEALVVAGGDRPRLRPVAHRDGAASSRTATT